MQAFDYRVPKYDATYITEQLYGAEDGGARGWLLWNPASRYPFEIRAIAQFMAGTAPLLSQKSGVQARGKSC